MKVNLGLTFLNPTLPKYKLISSENNLKEGKVEDIVFEFSKKGSQKRRLRKLNDFTSIGNNSQELGSNSSEAFPKSTG